MKRFRIWPPVLVAMTLAAPLGAQESTATLAQTSAPATTVGDGQEAAQRASPHAESGPGQSSTQNADRNTTQSQPALPDESALTREEAEKPKKKSNKEERLERLMGLQPSGVVVLNAASAQPLTPRDKLRIFAGAAYDPYHFLAIGISTAIATGADDLPEYGQDWPGYWQRYGTAFADSTIGGFFGTFLLPSLLHEDPRYFRMGSAYPIRRRLKHALARSFITRRDDGRRSVNYSNLLSGFLATSIGNAYYPEQQRGADITLDRGARHIPGASINAVVQEFWPDVRAKIFKKKSGEPKPH